MIILAPNSTPRHRHTQRMMWIRYNYVVTIKKSCCLLMNLWPFIHLLRYHNKLTYNNWMWALLVETGTAYILNYASHHLHRFRDCCLNSSWLNYAKITYLFSLSPESSLWGGLRPHSTWSLTQAWMNRSKQANAPEFVSIVNQNMSESTPKWPQACSISVLQFFVTQLPTYAPKPTKLWQATVRW